MYLDRAALLAAATALAERDYTDPLLPGPIRLRELTAQQIVDARVAARASGEFDAALFNAMVCQSGTKEPALTAADVTALTAGRPQLVERWMAAVWALSEARPGDLKSGGTGDDAAGDDDAGAGAAAPRP